MVGQHHGDGERKKKRRYCTPVLSEVPRNNDGRDTPSFVPSSLRDLQVLRALCIFQGQRESEKKDEGRERRIDSLFSFGIFKVAMTRQLFFSIFSVLFEKKRQQTKRIREREREDNSKLQHHKSCTPDTACTLTEMYALTHVRDAQYTTTINR